MLHVSFLKLSIILTHVMTVCVFLVGLFYAAPDRWILDYKKLTVSDACTDDLILQAQSERYPKITTIGRGEDNVFVYPLDGSVPIDRITWSDATYRAGTTNDSWPVKLHRTLNEGSYVLVGEPIIKFLVFERSINPITSAPFNITVCE